MTPNDKNNVFWGRPNQYFFGLYVQIFKEFISSICIYMLLIALVQVHTIMLSEKLA